jgi:hypothetical protein
MTGTTKSVSKVEVSIPPTTARAIGARISAPAPIPNATGSIPKIMASVVMRSAGVSCAAVITASRRSIPRRRRTLV